MELKIPELQTNMIVITANSNIQNITPNKKYIITNVYKNMICVRNDIGIDTYYLNMNFIEVDIYYTMLLYMTYVRLLNLSKTPLNS